MTALSFGIQEVKAQNPDFIKMIGYATKAPSGHNTQPWKFIISESSIEIHPDFGQALPVVDASNRELYISLGCAAENLIIAASESGYESSFSIHIDDKNHTYIRIDLKKGKCLSSPLFEQIERRQTNRRVYNKRMITQDTMSLLKSVFGEEDTKVRFYKNGSPDFLVLANLISEGNTVQMSDEAFKAELLSWIRYNKKHKDKTKNGLTNEVMGTPSAPAFIGKPIVNSFLKPDKQNKTDMEKINSSSHMVLFSTEQNNPENWILLGRRLELFLLAATWLGIANAYLNQPCEVESIAAMLPSKLKLGNEIPVLLLRIGYAEPMPFAPRKEINDVIEFKNN